MCDKDLNKGGWYVFDEGLLLNVIMGIMAGSHRSAIAIYTSIWPLMVFKTQYHGKYLACKVYI